jgi:PAS domain S-box-containing protein
MDRNHKRIGYLIAVVAAVVVLLFRLALRDALAEQARLLPFILPVIAAAWWGGLGPGLWATAVALLLGVFFIVPPDNSLRIETLADGLNAAIFVVVGVTVSYLCEELHVSRSRETEKQFRTLADSIPQLVWMARPDGSRFWFNQRSQEYTGATSVELAGSGWQSFVDLAQLPQVLDSWQSAVDSGASWEATYPIRRNDGQMRWHLARAVPVRNEAGTIVCWFGTTTDIEDRIEAEDALKGADARKDQFLALLAHELRNPLAPISNALQLWPSVANDKAEMERLRLLMTRQVGQLVRLIDDLMDVSRITHGKITLRRGPVDVNQAVRNALEAAQPLITTFNHRLTVTLLDEPATVDADAARLTQIFSNLLNNAAKYTSRQGEISISVDRHNDQVVVRVRDNGPGVAAHELTEIFKPFRQIEGTLTRSQGGLGIGLMLAKQLVELHGGAIEVRSDGLGKGSEFVVSLPVLNHAEVTSKDDDARRTPALTTGLGHHRVLVVDDLFESADTLAKLLHTLGQEASAVSSGAAALEWALANDPDVVFLDIAMPEVDGYEVARRMRRLPQLHDIVLVALTGFGQPGDRARAFEAGFDFYLTKPTNIDALQGLLRKLPAESNLPQRTRANVFADQVFT